MSDKIAGFRGRTIADVQTRCFLRDLPNHNGRYRYPSAGLNAPSGSIVLFQFRARIIASAIFLHNEKYNPPIHGHAGALHFNPQSFQTFDPVDAQTMQKIWPAFKSFGHIKQSLNPTRYPLFKKHLKHQQTPQIP